jgi:tetraacyldisaccharide 4'-kinase
LNRFTDYYRALTSGANRGPLAGVQRGILRAISIPYGIGVRVRNGLFDRGWKKSVGVTVPVVSVGNLTMGGTGKTPCVEYIADLYRRHDIRPVILSRGYGANGGRNDEAMVLEENLPDVPHLLGPDRASLAQTAIDELESELIILDDGFQHRRLRRDLDLVLIDCTNPWGHGHLFPRGWLREPPSSLCRAGIVVLTHSDQVASEEKTRIAERVRRYQDCPIVKTSHQPAELVNAKHQTESLDHLRDRPVLAFCGIGNPDGFRRTLEKCGAEMRGFRAYPDHHNYARADVEELKGWARQQPRDCLVATTQKDLVKLRLERLEGRELWSLRIRLRVEDGQEVFDGRLLSFASQEERNHG